MFPFQVIMNGIIIGSIYALIAIGFSLIYRQLKFINLFHGALYLSAAYLLFLFFNIFGFSFLFSALIAIICVIFLNIVVTDFLFTPLTHVKKNSSTLLIASFVLLLLIENIIILFFGSDPKVVHLTLLEKSISFLKIQVSLQQILIVAVSLLSMLFFYLFIQKTRTGLKIKAVSHNKTFAELKGISPRKVIIFSAGLSAFFSAVAGILITLEQNIEPRMGFVMIFKGITAAIIGGNKIHGAVVGALLIGIIENISVWYFPSGYKNLITFLLLIVCLVFKPEGLFTAKRREDATHD